MFIPYKTLSDFYISYHIIRILSKTSWLCLTPMTTSYFPPFHPFLHTLSLHYQNYGWGFWTSIIILHPRSLNHHRHHRLPHHNSYPLLHHHPSHSPHHKSLYHRHCSGRSVAWLTHSILVMWWELLLRLAPHLLLWPELVFW